MSRADFLEFVGSPDCCHPVEKDSLGDCLWALGAEHLRAVFMADHRFFPAEGR